MDFYLWTLATMGVLAVVLVHPRRRALLLITLVVATLVVATYSAVPSSTWVRWWHGAVAGLWFGLFTAWRYGGDL